MFIEILKKEYGTNTPIFTEEILKLFSKYSRAQVFRYINQAKENGKLIQFAKGVYYLPIKTKFGLSSISVDEIISKKYLFDRDEVIGIHSGLTLKNDFSITTQVPFIIEIVSNQESSKKREITFQGRHFILKKSRFKIDKNNYAAYMILQLFTELKKDEEIDNNARMVILDYVKRKKISSKELLDLSIRFPAKTTQNLVRSKLLNDIA